MSEATKYSYSTDEEIYHGTFDTIEQACDEAAGEVNIGSNFWVGEQSKPSPESYWDADDWLEHVSCQDDFAGDWAENWDESTKEQREELQVEVRAVMAAWLKRHNLEPKFWNINKPRKFYVAGKVGEVYEIEAL